MWYSYLAFPLSYSTVCETKPFLFIYLTYISLMYVVYVCACVWVGSAHSCVKARGWCVHQNHFCILSIVTGSFTQAWAHWSARLAECPGSSCLCFPTAGITGVCSRSRLCMWVLETKHWFSCLHNSLPTEPSPQLHHLYFQGEETEAEEGWLQSITRWKGPSISGGVLGEGGTNDQANAVLPDFSSCACGKTGVPSSQVGAQRGAQLYSWGTANLKAVAGGRTESCICSLKVRDSDVAPAQCLPSEGKS